VKRAKKAKNPKRVKRGKKEMKEILQIFSLQIKGISIDLIFYLNSFNFLKCQKELQTF
jgi:hypothetical protein